MVKESLKEAFAEDVALLKQVGLKPVVVHGGGPEVTRTLEQLGERSEFIDGAARHRRGVACRWWRWCSPAR